jgi:ABC-2 type transport system permease protein
MSAMTWIRLTVWELRRFLRQRGTLLILAALLGAGLMALELGEQFWQAQQKEISALPAHYEMQMKRLSARYAQGGEAGYWAYYTAFPTMQHPHPLAGLAWGVRDVVPLVTWVRLLGLEPQLYESPLGNPVLQAAGGFDLAFVLGLLAPFALLLLAHDALSRDASCGTLPMLAAQSGGLLALLAARVGAALLLVGGICTLLWGLALAWPGLAIPLDREAFIWLAAVLAQLLFWAALVAVIASRARHPGASLAGAFGGWVFFVVLLPALMNLTLSVCFPIPEGLELTVRQRQAMHSTWDQPRQPNFERFLSVNKDWPHGRSVPQEFSWTWFYAMHELADRSVADLADAYVQRLRARRDWAQRLAWLSPPVLLQLRLSATARTDLESHLVHLGRVREFHGRLKEHFFPLIARDQSLLPADTAAFPHFTDNGPPVNPSPHPLPPLLLTVAALLLVRPSRLLSA